MAAELTIHFEEKDFTISTFGNLLLWCFRGEVSRARVKRSHAVHHQLAKAYPNGFAVCTVIGESVPISMAADARDLSVAITAEFRPRYCAISEIVQGSGFRASIVRSITSGFRLLARSSCPSKVFGQIDPCAAWMTPYMSQAAGFRIEPAEFSAAAARVCTFAPA